MKRYKLLFAVIGSIAVLGDLVASASATRLSSSSSTLRATFPRFEFVGPFGTTTCILTLEGSLHSRTITKTAGLLMGYITRAILGTCTAGSATILRESLPWHIQYGSFSGTLPNNIMTLVTNVVGFNYRVRESGGVTCLFRSTVAEPIRLTANVGAGNVLSSVSAGGRVRSGDECLRAAGAAIGTSNSLTLLGGSETITITLI